MDWEEEGRGGEYKGEIEKKRQMTSMKVVGRGIEYNKISHH